MPVKRNSPFKLEVYKVGENQPELSQEITLDNSKNIELLKLVGRDIAISSSLKEYTTFTPIISYSDPNTDLYTVTFNNGVLSNKVKNYIAEADLSGTLKIVRNADGQVLYEQDMTIMPEGQFSLMQLSDTDFWRCQMVKNQIRTLGNILKFVSFIRLMLFPVMTSCN